LCLANPGLATEFVNGPPVDKPVAERRSFGNKQASSNQCGQNSSKQADSPIHLAKGTPLGKRELASLLARGRSSRNACLKFAHAHINDAPPPVSQQAIRGQTRRQARPPRPTSIYIYMPPGCLGSSGPKAKAKEADIQNRIVANICPAIVNTGSSTQTSQTGNVIRSRP
jgi:hypothetical protein